MKAVVFWRGCDPIWRRYRHTSFDWCYHIHVATVTPSNNDDTPPSKVSSDTYPLRQPIKVSRGVLPALIHLIRLKLTSEWDLDLHHYQ